MDEKEKKFFNKVGKAYEEIYGEEDPDSASVEGVMKIYTATLVAEIGEKFSELEISEREVDE